jgi:hypothetical protein
LEFLADDSTPFYTFLRLFERAKQSISGIPWERARQSFGRRRESWDAKILGQGRQALPRRRRTSGRRSVVSSSGTSIPIGTGVGVGSPSNSSLSRWRQPPQRQ